MFKNKFFGFAIIAGIILTFVLALAQIPVKQAKLQEVPLAIVNEDQGQLGQKVVDKVTEHDKSSDKRAAFKWSKVSSTTTLKSDMNHQHYYGAIVIPKDFSKKIGTLATSNTAQPAQVKIYINEAKNSTLATSLKSGLTAMVGGIGQGIQGQIVGQLAQHHVSVSASAVTRLSNPIVADVETVHSTKGLTAANTVFFQPIWLASLVVSLLLFYAGKEIKFTKRTTRFGFKFIQVAVAAGLALMIGFATTWYLGAILNYHFDNFGLVGMFVSLTSFAFIMLFSGVIAWLEFPGLIVFVLLLFFSAPLLTMAPEMLPNFYQNWVLPWLPMKPLFDGLKSILYYGAGLWNSSTQTLVTVMIIGGVIFFAESLSSRNVKLETAKN
ncbi:YhgE/Pip domain-containing protein [Pediococcus argentinicus]|uniref:DUF3533 domain-containing protein n=1 Tax=Pediococcus argentinicus TaxID=480391 RepID=A0A0R2NGG0_9LACO|nr:DUF3533 domain-containing protein [Pediococcus argentinicus]KRO24884.1 hypothetical protein IV88_GL000548 [Pediococcus argentinicus]NKZ22581.1 DUF3533 domain-containing protein [Pediococcus argentinicus]GEP19758.1 phage infection protein [Pediococcus argentinicus]